MGAVDVTAGVLLIFRLVECRHTLNKDLIYVLYATFYIHLFSDIPLFKIIDRHTL